MRFIYTLLLSLFIPFIILRIGWRSFQNPAHRERLVERFAVLPKPEVPVKVWVHAVSVGETMAAKPSIESLLAVYGDHAVMVSSTTLTGSDTVKRLFKGRVVHHYFPYDLPMLTSRYLKKINPCAFVCMETEIWPNLWHSCRQQSVPIVLANARLSTRSTQRYLKFQKFVASVLNDASIIACRNDQDAENFAMLGVSAEKIQVFGDIKSDIQLSAIDKKKGESYKEQWGVSRPVLVAASTHEGEDSLILDLYTLLKARIDDVLLVIVPRHPERFDDVAKLIASRELSFQRRSVSEPFTANIEVVLGDSMGEMMSWYEAADIVFMGGSLVPTGGHNPLEPLACTTPVISGPHVFNFKNTFDLLCEHDAAFVASDVTELSQKAIDLLSDEMLRKATGERGLAIIEKDKGATQRLVKAITGMIKL